MTTGGAVSTLYKSVRPDGTSFHDPRFRWLRRDGKPHAGPVRHPASGGLGYLSVSTVPTDCTGMRWPCRLLTVEPVGDVWTPQPCSLPNKRAALAFRVTGERPAHEVFGPQGEAVVALIERAGRLTHDEARALAAARAAAGVATRAAAGVAAWALVVRDLITPEQFNTLYGPWASVIGDES